MRQAQGEALYAMELALSLEKLNFTKLRELWKTANEMEDGQLTDFIGMPSSFLWYIHILCSHQVVSVQQLVSRLG